MVGKSEAKAQKAAAEKAQKEELEKKVSSDGEDSSDDEEVPGLEDVEISEEQRKVGNIEYACGLSRPVMCNKMQELSLGKDRGG